MIKIKWRMCRSKRYSNEPHIVFCHSMDVMYSTARGSVVITDILSIRTQNYTDTRLHNKGGC